MSELNYPQAIADLGETITGETGVMSQAVRQAIVAQTVAAIKHGEPQRDGMVPANLQAYLQKVATHSYKVTDQDINRLKYAGYSEDEIFEATVGVAFGAALARVETAFALFEN